MLAGTLIGPFAVEKELGSGAMGSVYKARYEKTGKRVAIKIIAPGLAGNKRAVERFEREANILKQLKHPHIVRLIAIGKYQGTLYYAMEYIEGESLDHVMARRGRITWEEVVTMGQQLCSALQHAHEKGIIHRDLKPSNLMVLADGTLKLTDFGIAKDLDVTQLTSANCTVGTASYMSPEQCKGERDLTPRSDLYSLGVVFYELVTGRKPFIAETPMDIFLQHVQGTFERPSRLVLDIPVWLDNLICQLLEKKPEQRPLDAARIGETLGQIMEKVEAQQSAGVDAVKTRLKDRASTDLELDSQDKTAARSLLGKKKKARRKDRGVPFYQKIWFKAVLLSVVLVGLGYLLFGVLLRPRSPADLLKDTKSLMAKGDWEEAREGPIADYLNHYPDSSDKIGQQMQVFADDVDGREQERLVLLWIRSNVRVTGDEDPVARKAVSLEDEGDPDEAWKTWETLLPKAKDSNRKIRAWGLLAKKRLAELQTVYDLARELDARIGAAHAKLEIFKPEMDDKGRAGQARHFAIFGDHWEARDRWRKIQKQFDPKVLPRGSTSSGQRMWFVISVWQGRESAKKAANAGDEGKGRLDLIKAKIKEAEGLQAKKPKEAKAIYQDILSLYEGVAETDKGLAKLVKTAKEKLEQ